MSCHCATAFTDCCGAPKAACVTVTALDGEGVPDVTVCKDGHGCMRSVKCRGYGCTACVHDGPRDVHPSDGCGLCGWDGGPDDPCPSHSDDVAAWNAAHGWPIGAGNYENGVGA